MQETSPSKPYPQVSRLAVDHDLPLLKKPDLLPIPHARLHMHRQHHSLAFQLDVFTLLALSVLHLLKHAGAELAGDDLVSAVAFSGSGRRLDDVFIPDYLEGFARVEVPERAGKAHDHVSALGSLFLGLLATPKPKTTKSPKKPVLNGNVIVTYTLL